MGELTLGDDENIRVPDRIYHKDLGTLLWKKQSHDSVPNCPECVAREKKKIQTKYEAETPEENRNRDDLFRLFDEIEFPMKLDPSTKHFICKRCGLYATREQIGDIKEKINRREKTRQDRQDEYLEWWQKSKTAKQQ